MTTYRQSACQEAPLRAEGTRAGQRPLPQATFDDLYSAVYRILDDAKNSHDLVKLYKGSHASEVPHQAVLDFGSFFFQTRRGLLAYACSAVNPHRPAVLADLDAYDREHQPRLGVRAVFNLMAATGRRPGESREDFLRYLTARTHALGAYRGGSSGYDDEARAVAAAHFSNLSVPATPGQAMIFSGGAKGAFLAFCAALMCRRHHDDLDREGGLLLAPEGYYQSLRLIPPIFGGDIHVIPGLNGGAVERWLARTSEQPNRVIYVPLVNNADGKVLTRPAACSIARAILSHNAACPDRPVYVLADDVYAGSYLSDDTTATSIAAVHGAAVGDPALGPMSDWTFTVVTSSKTFALPTTRVAFATTTSPALLNAAGHYRTALSLGRVPQAMELTAAAALCLTPQPWIDEWNSRYRQRLLALQRRISALNTELHMNAFRIQIPAGGWYLTLRVSPDLFPGRVASSVDAFAVLLHYGRGTRDTGIAMLPGELFGYRTYDAGFTLRGTLGPQASELDRFTRRLSDAARLLRGPDGPGITQRALARAREVADIDTILAHCRY
jgi:aspartate/methionine/tyrosine aminotransferase